MKILLDFELPDYLNRGDIQFAAAQAMNEAAFATRLHTVEKAWPSAVTVRNKRFAAAAFNVTEKANKRSLAVSVADRLGRDAFARQAEGGTRKPVSGRSLAIPLIKRTAGGAVGKTMRPKAILRKKGYFVNHTHTAIMRRYKGGKLKLVYVLTPQAQVEPRFDIWDEAEREFDRVFPIAWNKAAERIRINKTVRG